MDTKQGIQRSAGLDRLDRNAFGRIEAVVYAFLAEREVLECLVRAFDLNGQLFVHVHVNPNRAIRHSNLIEIQLRSTVLQKTGLRLDFVLWRFSLSASHEDDVDHILITAPYEKYGHDEPFELLNAVGG